MWADHIVMELLRHCRVRDLSISFNVYTYERFFWMSFMAQSFESLLAGKIRELNLEQTWKLYKGDKYKAHWHRWPAR